MDISDLDRFEIVCEFLGENATQEEMFQLADFARGFGHVDLRMASEIALHTGVPGLYTELSMTQGERGI